MVDYMAAIKKPFSDMKTLGIGTVLGAIPLVNILVSGYILKVAEDTIKKKNALRKWAIDDVIDYIVKAIMAIIISVVYMIIPLILIGFGIGGAVMAALASLTTDPTQIGVTVMNSLAAGAPLIILGALLAIIATLLLPMAMMKWLKAGKLGAAFNIITVIKNALTKDYIITLIVIFIYAIVLALIIGVISIILAFIPVIGWILVMLLSGLMSFAIGVTAYTALAQTVK